MDKLLELLLGLRKDVDALRSDVHALSEKVDHLTPQSQQQTAQAVQSVNVEQAVYGRQLSASEQAYLDRLHHTENTSATAQGSASAPEHDTINVIPQAPPVAPVASAPVYITPTGPNAIERFFAWLAKDWPMKVGGFFVIAAVGWFVTYAARVGWLSPAARVVLGYIFAVACVAFGTLRAEKERTQGNVFLIIGSGAMLISTLAGMYFDLIMHSMGLFVMLIAVGFVTLVSLKQKSVALTSSMIFFGAIIPLFFFSGVGINTIFAYLFILTLGTLWIVSFTQWRGLTFFMLCVVGVYSIGYMIDAYDSADIESVTNIIIAFLFAATFYVASVASVIKSQKPHAYDLVTAIGIGFLFLVWMLSFAPEVLEVPLILIGTLFFVGASYIVFVRTGHRSPTVIYAGVGAMLFAVATALQFDGPILVTAYAVEAAAVVLIVLYLMRQNVTSGMRAFFIILYVIPVLMSLYYVATIFDYLLAPDYDTMSQMSALFAVTMICVTAFAVAAGVLRLVDTRSGGNMALFRTFAYTGGIYALLIVWFVTHIFMSDYDVATFVALVLYTITGVIFYVLGIRESYKPYMVVGGILFGLVVLRVLFVEFWGMDIVMRIITSFVLGALLISTAFIRTSKK
ncbi:MAG: DUF2339 domain-containing protein [Parcubacteria group bacterium]|jgi:uncharacterized membrane protein